MELVAVQLPVTLPVLLGLEVIDAVEVMLAVSDKDAVMDAVTLSEGVLVRLADSELVGLAVIDGVELPVSEAVAVIDAVSLLVLLAVVLLLGVILAVVLPLAVMLPLAVLLPLRDAVCDGVALLVSDPVTLALSVSEDVGDANAVSDAEGVKLGVLVGALAVMLDEAVPEALGVSVSDGLVCSLLARAGLSFCSLVLNADTSPGPNAKETTPKANSQSCGFIFELPM